MFMPAPKQGLWEQVCGLGAVSTSDAEDGLAVKGQELCYWARISPVRKTMEMVSGQAISIFFKGCVK